MEKSEKLSLIERFQSSIATAIDFVASAPPDAIDFRPSLAGAWTIRDHAVHLLDADTFAYARLRLAVTQPGNEVLVWNEEAWQERARYESADPLACLQAAQSLRRVVADMAKALADADWEAFHIRHPQRGRMTLVDVFKLYIDHVGFHMGYFSRNLEAYRKAAKKP